MKKNCWEFKKCGRQFLGEHVNDLGVCPTALEKGLDGIHGGTNAGRTCWVVTGSLCGGQIQGSFAKKYENCTQCDFYQQVKKEEFPRFQLSSVLLPILKKENNEVSV